MKDYPAQMDVTIYIHASEFGGPLVSTVDMTKNGYVLLGTEQITVEIPAHENADELKLQFLQAKRRKVLADAEREAQKLEDQITCLRTTGRTREVMNG